MTEALTPPFERARQGLATDGVRAARLRIAERRTKDLADAVDLVQEALARVLAPDGEKTFVMQTDRLVNSLASHEWQSARVRPEVVDSRLAHDKKIVDPAPLVEDTLAERHESASSYGTGTRRVAGA